MKFIFAIGIVPTLANFGFRVRGAPLAHDYFVIGDRRNQNNPTQETDVGGNHDKNVFTTANGATSKTSTTVLTNFPNTMSKEWTTVENKKGKKNRGTPPGSTGDMTQVQAADVTADPTGTTADLLKVLQSSLQSSLLQLKRLMKKKKTKKKSIMK